MNYSRLQRISLANPTRNASSRDGGGRWIRTTEGVSQQIYSLPPLAAWVSLRTSRAFCIESIDMSMDASGDFSLSHAGPLQPALPPPPGAMAPLGSAPERKKAARSTSGGLKFSSYASVSCGTDPSRQPRPAAWTAPSAAVPTAHWRESGAAAPPPSSARSPSTKKCRWSKCCSRLPC